ncbi:MAG: hypothetical protein KDK70_16445 [Myxococcales bacterium]|nr:hypothetical protein [Myxococcales bacterium]
MPSPTIELRLDDDVLTTAPDTTSLSLNASNQAVITCKKASSLASWTVMIGSEEVTAEPKVFVVQPARAIEVTATLEDEQHDAEVVLSNVVTVRSSNFGLTAYPNTTRSNCDEQVFVVNDSKHKITAQSESRTGDVDQTIEVAPRSYGLLVAHDGKVIDITGETGEPVVSVGTPDCEG